MSIKKKPVSTKTNFCRAKFISVTALWSFSTQHREIYYTATSNRQQINHVKFKKARDISVNFHTGRLKDLTFHENSSKKQLKEYERTCW